MTETLGSQLNSAQLCRDNEWQAGTLLWCEESFCDAAGEWTTHECWLLLTAVGHSSILARWWATSQKLWSGESSFHLNQRSWRRALPLHAPRDLVAAMQLLEDA